MTDIKQLRESRGWSMYRLSKESGVCQSQISRIERGQNCGIATYDRLMDALTKIDKQKLADSLKMPVDYLSFVK